jgi:hypothetical protein
MSMRLEGFSYNSYRCVMTYEELPLKPVADQPKKERNPAPAWLALAAPWLGLLTLLLSITTFIVPGSRDSRAEITHARPYSPADWIVMIGLYSSVIAVFAGLLVIWQMRTQPRPLSTPLAAQRLQAIFGLVLACIGIAIIYIGVLSGPGRRLPW